MKAEKALLRNGVIVVLGTLFISLMLGCVEEGTESIVFNAPPTVKLEALCPRPSLQPAWPLSGNVACRGDVVTIKITVADTDNDKLDLDLKIDGHTVKHINQASPGTVIYHWSTSDAADGIHLLNATVSDAKASVSDTVEVTVIPMLRIGDTIPSTAGKTNLSMTLLSSKEGKIAVYGTYSGGDYYTFTAKPGRKFFILVYRFKNNWNRPQETPYISSGEVNTTKGFIFSVWSPPAGIWSEEYEPRQATAQEIEELVGDSQGYVELWPGEESKKGCVVFEIPEGEYPHEISLYAVRGIIEIG